MKFSMTKQKFINQWLRHFANGVSKIQIESYVKDQYIWHVFSYDLISDEKLLMGDEARNAFDQADKSACICCDMFGNSGVREGLSGCDSSKMIEEHFTELYVVAKDYSWTYSKTHENGSCGPYFYRK